MGQWSSFILNKVLRPPEGRQFFGGFKLSLLTNITFFSHSGPLKVLNKFITRQMTVHY